MSWVLLDLWGVEGVLLLSDFWDIVESFLSKSEVDFLEAADLNVGLGL